MIPKKAFVTGATGFLGSHLIDRLLEKGWEVHALVRKSSNLRWLSGKKINLYYGDVVGDLAALREGLKEVDLCFHLAGVIRAARPSDYDKVNAEGTRNVLESLLQVNPKVGKVVVVTSLAASGPAQNGRPLNETDDCRPVTDYGKSKLKAEKIAMSYCDRLPVTIIRPPGIYGPRDTQIYHYFKMATRGFIILPRGGERRLNLVHSDDVVQGILLAAESPQSTGETFFIGDGENYSWEEIVDQVSAAVRPRGVFKLRLPKSMGYLLGGGGEIFMRLTGQIIPINLTNIKNFFKGNWVLDIGKARRILGYRPTHPLAEGLQETAAWYRKQGWL